MRDVYLTDKITICHFLCTYRSRCDLCVRLISDTNADCGDELRRFNRFYKQLETHAARLRQRIHNAKTHLHWQSQNWIKWPKRITLIPTKNNMSVYRRNLTIPCVDVYLFLLT